MFRQYPILLLTFFALLFSTTVRGNSFADISLAYTPSEINEIMVGDSMAPIIEIEANTPLPLGVAVILTELQDTSLTLAQGQLLGNALAEKGWNVVVSPLNLPMIKQTAPQANSTEDTQNSQTSVNNAPAEINASNDIVEGLHPRSNLLSQHLDFESATTHLTLHLNALNNHLQSRQGYRLYIAQGMAASSYLSALQMQPELYPDSFVAISPFWPETLVNSNVIENIAESSYPVLDISLDGVSEWSDLTAEERKKRSKNNLKIHYRQIKIPSKSLSFSINKKYKPLHIQQVADRTIGWTRHLGW